MASVEPPEPEATSSGRLPNVPSLTIVCEDRTVVVRLGGDQDLSVVTELADALSLISAVPGGDVVVDLTLVPFVDLAIVRALARGREQLEAQSRNLVVRGSSRTVGRALRLCGLLEAERLGAEIGAEIGGVGPEIGGIGGAQVGGAERRHPAASNDASG